MYSLFKIKFDVLDINKIKYIKIINVKLIVQNYRIQKHA